MQGVMKLNTSSYVNCFSNYKKSSSLTEGIQMKGRFQFTKINMKNFGPECITHGDKLLKPVVYDGWKVWRDIILDSTPSVDLMPTHYLALAA